MAKDRQPAAFETTPAGNAGEVLQQRAALLFMLDDLERSRKQVEQAHQEWVAALDVVNDPIFLHDKEFRILRCNRAYQQRAGTAFLEIIGKPYYEIFPKSGSPLPCCLRSMEKAEEGEEEVAVGETIYRSRAFSIKDEQGDYLYSVHTLEDITERKRAAEALSESKTRFRNLVETTSDWIWEVDENTVYTYASPKIHDILGYQAAEIIGKTPYDLMPPAEAKRVAEVFGQIRAAKKSFTSLENTNLHKDGHRVVLETSGVPVIDPQGKFCGYRGMDRDITARKQAEDTLRESEERYRSLFENMLEGYAYCKMLFEHDTPLDFIYLNVNDAFEKITGLKDVVGRKVSEVIPGIHESNPELLEIYGRVALTGQPKAFETFVAVLEVWLSITVYSPHKEYFVAVFNNITGRKRAEDTLQKSEERYRQIIQTSMDGFWITDTKGRILDVNDAYCRLTGYAREELLNMRIPDVEAKETPEETAQHMQEVMTKGYARFETHHRRKDGQLLDFEVSVVHQPYKEDGHFFIFLRDITGRKQAEAAIEHANRAIATLGAVNHELIHATNENELLQAICRAIVEQRGYRMAWVGYVQHDESKSIKIMARAGHDEGYLDAMQLTWAETERGMGPSGRAIRSGATQLCQDMLNDPSYLLWRAAASQRGYASDIALPLTSESGDVFGILHVYSEEMNAFSPAEIDLLEEMAGDLAFGRRTLLLRRERDRALEQNQQQLVQLQDSLEDTVRAIATIVEMRDPYTSGHQVRVADLASAIATQMGLPDEQVHAIHLAGVVHDLGKMHIPAEILSKPGKITDLEFSFIKTHAQAGYDILQGIHFPWPIAQMVLQHHERLDGSGYPQGLKGDAILLEARILSVADVVEAMYSHRPYRPGLGIEVALAEITKQRGIYFDPAAVDACLALFREQHYTFKN